ncbi:MAG TPA: hypothetical protein VNK82_12175 [Terriglobales bacterium]|nr:hypothetical protein [Terriglobales bacterium]
MFYRLADPNTRAVHGICIRLELLVENRGNRHSTVNKFDLAIPELKKSYSDLRQLRKTGVQTTTAHVGIAGTDLAPGDVLTVEAEKTIGPGQLVFFVNDIPEKDTHFLSCVLTLRDTIGGSESHTFETPEYGHGTW